MKTKFIAILLVILSALTLVSCKTKLSDDEKAIKNMTSLEVAEAMGNGTNLGNTMEAFARGEFGVDGEVSNYETSWEMPETTKAIIDGIYEAGFDTIRIPVAWTNMINYEEDDFTINKKLLNRVAEIITWALNNDMYVIINDHWDGGWWGMFGSAEEELQTRAWNLYEEMWKQIGNHFKDYSYRLIFESANEELGHRLNDEIDGVEGKLTVEEQYVLTNEINQKFVDVIRSTGGNNEDRFLLIAGFNTDINATIDSRFEMPEDKVENKLLISVHYYDPSPYTIFESVPNWGTAQNHIEQNQTLAKMEKYTKEGYGVVIGEYGVLRKEDGTYKDDMQIYFENFLANIDVLGYVPMLWDTSDFYIRKDLAFKDKGLENLFKEQSNRQRTDKTREEIINSGKKKLEDNIEKAIQREKDEGTWIDQELGHSWLMFSNTDWDISYSMGDTYTPTAKTAGLVATDKIIEGAGTYTLGLDFTKVNGGVSKEIQFLAIGIANGEALFPGYVIDIKEIKINGEVIKMTAIGYTTSDDDNTTRVNIYNPWIPEQELDKVLAEDDVRVKIPAQLRAAKPIIVNPLHAKDMQTIEVTFEFIAR